MKIFIRTLSIIVVLIAALTYSNIHTLNALSNTSTRKTVKIGVLLYDFNNVFNSLIKSNLEDIQKENQNKVEFTFFDGKSNPATETEIFNNFLQNNYDIILASIIDTEDESLMNDFVDKARQKNIPLVFFDMIPYKLDSIKTYDKSLIINSDEQQAGSLQGKMISDAWNSNKEAIDKNNDDIMDYIILKGEPSSLETELRTNNSISTINNSGIKTHELASVSAKWDQNLAKNAIESLFLKYGNNIEVIIANNDSMAIGAIQALQNYGYNDGDGTKNIPVYGINGIPEAQDLIRKNFMAGSVLLDYREFANALYTVSINLLFNNNPLEGTNYKFDETDVIILIPWKGIMQQPELPIK